MKNSEVTKYLRDIIRIGQQAEATPELSLREPLLRLARTVAAEAGRPNLLIAPEASAEEAGQPDIFIKDGPRLIGFIETKPPNTDLPRVLRSERQLKRYRKLLPNWILTDYYRFLTIREGEITRRFEIEKDSPEVLVSTTLSKLEFSGAI
jgi:hypothetical protein